MHRLFVALRPPPAMRDALLDLAETLPGIRWQGDEQLHVTLRFIGEVDRHQAEDIAAALGAVRAPPLMLALDGIGRFERRGGPGTLWAGVTPHDAVGALHRKIDQALIRAGLAPEGRAFLPHITLARLPRGSSPMLDGFVARHAGLSGPPERFGDFRLYESRLGREGADYTIVERYPLG